ncbi:hypothetical protein L596_029917 [Steinernema carpocapsae]|uniref:Uncharacterized protein n=1 Tax=Steinernema carpocapsae TaxID=34508 RepID=A0A4U5LR65_STECR|nr:hypothetical protein L596_029917 [Steinernema carpocapsae]
MKTAVIFAILKRSKYNCCIAFHSILSTDMNSLQNRDPERLSISQKYNQKVKIFQSLKMENFTFEEWV